jgi:hypothetical protein
MHTKVWSGKLKGRDHLEVPDTDGQNILKQISKKQDVGM